MSKGCIFVGGVHGSGKTELCKKIQERIDCVYLSASQLLKWSKKEKNVENVQENQRILKELLKKEMQDDKLYLIDGHFALWNNENECEMVPLWLYENLGLKCIIMVEMNAETICKRLFSRDHFEVGLGKTKQLISTEKANAQFVSKNLSIPLYCVYGDDEIQLNLLLNSIEACYGN
jgi:adenylate kinase